jgi:hypothetical protein
LPCCEGRGCGHVSGLVVRDRTRPAGPDVVRVIPGPIRVSRSRSADNASGLGMGPQPLASRHSHPRFLVSRNRQLYAWAGLNGFAEYGVWSRSRGFPPHLIGRLVLPEADIDRVSQEVVGPPGQVGDLGDQLRLDPVHSREDQRRSEARGGEALRPSGSRRRLKSARTLTGVRVHVARIDELATPLLLSRQPVRR